MTANSIGFIGGGRITRIILEGWKRAGKLPARIAVSDCNAEALARLKAHFPEVEALAGEPAVAAAQDIVFLAVHPPAMPDTANAIKGRVKSEAVVVSLAPKFTIAKLSSLLGGFTRIVRVIPNAPSIVNLGYNPVAFSAVLSPLDRAEITGLFAPLGEFPEIDEQKLEAYALLSAMGPTYLWFQLQALREVAASFGLSDAEVAPALKRMVCGSARTLLESGLAPAEVMDLIPVKPLAEMEPQVGEMYRTRLPALFEKMKP